MRSSRTISLFSDRPDTSRQSPSFVVSILVHGAVIGLLFLGILFPPRLSNKILTERYDLRHLDLQTPEEQMRRAAASGIDYPRPRTVTHKLAPGGSPKLQRAVLRLTSRAPKAPQTLVQPMIPPNPKPIKATPLPTVVLWKPEISPVKAIVPPPPAKPMAAPVLPSFEAPNKEVNLADVRISATALAAQKLPILPSTTSPVVVRGPDLPQTPATTSVSTAQPTPTAVLSLSDIRMNAGTVFLPPVNESASADSPGTLTQGEGKDPSQPGKGNLASKASGSGAGLSADDPKDKAGLGGGAGKGGAKTGRSESSQTASDSGEEPPTTTITMAKDGRFGSVVVGASLQERYPETAELLSGRLAYTVYLHLGVAKSWILQYTLPRAVDDAEMGNINHLEAPWPYNIVRPNLAPDSINADAVMVHGYVNKAGRFEELAIVFPPEFPRTKFVLDALAQWQFRPAARSGQVTRVEILLIIPDESD
jgi:hypothetical protein